MKTTQLKPATTYAVIVGRVVAEMRKRLNLRQENMAAEIGVTQSTWSRIENGTSAMTISQLAVAARTLQSSPSIILNQADQAQRHLTSQGVQVQASSDESDNGLLFVGAAALGTLLLAIMARR